MTKDLPIRMKTEDTLGLSRYVDGMSDFVRGCDTPMTLSVQGGWGSGKTSFMYLLDQQLCKEAEAGFLSIWLQTWGLSLEVNAATMVSKLVNHIFRELKVIAQGYDESVVQQLDQVDRSFQMYCLSRVDGSGNALVAKDPSYKKAAILRQSFADLVQLLLHDKEQNQAKQGLIFFVDDLDNLDPAFTIVIIEALKSLFESDNCIFIMAVDEASLSRAVVEKYHLSEAEKDTVCRNYYQKMVQVPFMMPVSQYNVYQFMKTRLEGMEILSENDDKEEMMREIVEIISLSVGNNPRNLNQLSNKVHLSAKLEGKGYRQASQPYKLMLVLLMAIRLEYPNVYQLIETNIRYENWRHLIVVDAPPVSDREKRLFGLDQVWQEVVYQAIQHDLVLKRRTKAIFTLLDKMKRLSEQCEEKEQMSTVVELVAMASRDIPGTVVVEYHGSQETTPFATPFIQGNQLIERLHLNEYSSVLDVGCGNGDVTLQLLKRNHSLRVRAFDHNPNAIRVAMERRLKMSISSEQLEYFIMDAMDLEEEERYDLVFSNGALHWVPTPMEMYGKIYRALKPGGTLAVNQRGQDNHCGLHALVMKAIKQAGFLEQFENWEFPAYHPMKKEIQSLLEDVGFREVQVESEVLNNQNYEKIMNEFVRNSLPLYFAQLETKEQIEELKEAYLQLCETETVEIYTHRLYIQAKK